MSPRVSKIDALNVALIVAACIASRFFPFGVLTAAYAIMGPAHYLTQISWLHDKKYFTSARWFPMTMGVCAGLLTLVAMLPVHHEWFNAVILIAAAGMAGLSLARSRGAAAVTATLGAVALLVVGAIQPAAAFIAVLLPTVLHVLFFTAAFMLLGAIRSRSATGLAAVAVLLLASLSFWVFPIPFSTEPLGGAARFFRPVVDEMGRLGAAPSSTASVFGFLGMIYAYHYANWFSKAELIKWHRISRARMVVLVVTYSILLGIYAVNFTAGFVISLLLSILHVLLELPLDLRTFRDLASALKGGRQRAPADAVSPVKL